MKLRVYIYIYTRKEKKVKYKVHDWIVSFHWLSKKIQIWKIENYMAFCPSYKLPKKKKKQTKIRPRSTYPKTLNLKAKL